MYPETLVCLARLRFNLPVRITGVRPDVEAVGIDVYQTVRNNGLFIETLKEKGDPKNFYALMLVD